jgi:hypothetical protein
LCVEDVLQLGERLDARGERFLGARLILGAEVQRVAGIDVFEVKALTVGDAERFRKIAGPLDDFLYFHSCVSFILIHREIKDCFDDRG